MSGEFAFKGPFVEAVFGIPARGFVALFSRR